MKKTPETIADLQGHGSDSEALYEFLQKYWTGIDDVKPIGYDEFLKDYCDFAGMEEWQDNEKGKQEDDFNGFDDNNDGYNFVSTVSLPHIAYDDTCQGRPPAQMLISACIAYGFVRGQIYGKRDGLLKGRSEMREKLQALMLEIPFEF